MSSESNGERLPFEPKKKKKKSPKKGFPSSQEQRVAPSKKSEASLSAIPEIVSKRMVRRMALFSGIPTAIGISSFFISYLIVTYEWFELPNAAVLVASLGFFGLGVVGLSYGLLSASWDENRIGSWLGTEEFATNFGRMITAWKEARKDSQQANDG